ncbi:O-acyltransferase WSD1 [Trifolium repens]|nr:O-acyltransferase WSD1 [Trifolium repens]
MENIYEEVQEPVSPHGQYFNSSVMCSYVFGFLELAIPIDDDSQAIPLLKDVFLPINPRFSSIMVRDKHGKKRWQKVEVNLEEHLKEIKSKLGVTINDVICGIIFYGIRLYMEEMNKKTKTSDSTAVVMLNTRNIGGYQSLKEMQKPESKSLWGNQISFLQISIPKLSQSDPLEFVWKARKLIKRKRRSFSIHLIGLLLNLEMKLKGPEAVAKIIYNTMGNSSVVISNLVGPVEKMALANHPINGLYFTMTGGPENVDITIMSYVKILRITLRTLKGFIDEQNFKFCMEKAIEVIFKAAMEISEIPTKN